MPRIVLIVLLCLSLCGTLSAQDADKGEVIGRGGIPIIVPPIMKPAAHGPELVEIPKAAPDKWQRFLACVGEASGTENHFESEREELLRRAEEDGIDDALLADAEKFHQEITAVQN